MDAADVVALQALVRDVHVGADLLLWVTRLVRATRPARGAIARCANTSAGGRGRAPASR